MKLKNRFAKALSVLALAGMATSAHAIGSFNEFTVSEGSVPGSVANTFVADKGNGGYNEILTIKYDGTFASTAYADFGQFFKNDGADLVSPTQLNNLGSNGYGLYAIFDASGFLGATTFTGLLGSFKLYIDPNQDTTKALGATASAGVTLGGGLSDDYLIASTSTLVSGTGIPGTPGAFDFWFKDLVLTTVDQDLATAGVQAGNTYFTSPNPFHMVVDVNGDFDHMATLPGLPSFPDSKSVSTSGDVSFVFAVPEPASLALLGLGLLGLGVTGRRRATRS